MSKTAYWYCTNCHEEVDSSRVTWQELHDACGHHVEWIEGISIDRLREICAAERDGRLVVLDKKPVVRGEWTTNSDYPDTVICSLCGWRESVWWADKGTNYCPNCGAKMEVEP